MACFSGPEIPNDGVILYLDAANIKSYPGSGALWSDISTSVNSGTIFNSPVYNTAIGSGVFEANTAANTYVTFTTNPTFTNSATFEIWADWREPAANNFLMFGRESCYRVNFNGGYVSWVCCTVNNAWYSNGTVVTINTPVSGWKQYVFSYDGTYLYLYINGNLVANTSASFPISGNVKTNANNLKLWYSDTANISQSNGYFGSIKAYNRALSATEVRQNFEALRGRYGL